MEKHTAGPWTADLSTRKASYAVKQGEIHVALVNGGAGGDEGHANARRIVACVNAFSDGVPTDVIENREAWPINVLAMAASVEKFRRENADLLEALELAEATIQRLAPDGSRATQGTLDVIRAAIKKATQEGYYLTRAQGARRGE